MELRAIDRVKAVQAIARALRETMQEADLHVFFRHLNIDTEFNPHYDYEFEELAREYLQLCSDAQLLDIGDQLELSLPIKRDDLTGLGDSKFWELDHFRLFISHVHKKKEQAAALKKFLQKYGVTAFVAHEDINVSDDWRDEILRSLGSMDALLAILSDGFSGSAWTDQEVGVAIARDVLIVPITTGPLPYGFIANLQADKVASRLPEDVAADIFKTLVSQPQTRPKVLDCLVRTIVRSTDEAVAIFKVNLLDEALPGEDNIWSTLRENVMTNSELRETEDFRQAINPMLTKRNLRPVTPVNRFAIELDDEIPF